MSKGMFLATFVDQSCSNFSLIELIPLEAEWACPQGLSFLQKRHPDVFWTCPMSYGVPKSCFWSWVGVPASPRSLRSLRASLGIPVGPLRGSFDLPGAPWVLGLTLDFILRANVAQVPRLRTKSSLPEFSSGSSGSSGNGVSSRGSDPPFPTRRGSG